MQRLLAIVLTTSLLFAGLVTTAGGHPEVLFGDGDLALVGDGQPHPTGLLDHAGEDHCCHSVGHFAGILLDVSDAVPPLTSARASAAIVPAFVSLTHPPLPKPPRA